MPSSGFVMGGLIIDGSSQTELDYCTLAEVEAYAGVNFSDGIGPTDSQIATMISQASRMMDVYAGKQIAGQLGVTEYFDIHYSTQHIVLSQRPVASITTLHSVNDSGTETLMTQGRVRNTDDYWLADQEAGIVRFHGKYFNEETGKQALKVNYISGEVDPPANVKMATILWVVRAAARAAMNDENCMERIKEMWSRLLRSTESELEFWLETVKKTEPVAVATFGLEGGYGG